MQPILNVITDGTFLAGIAVGGIAVGIGLLEYRRRARRKERQWIRLARQILREAGREGDSISSAEAARAWQATRQEARRLSAVLYAMSEGLALLNGDNRIVFCNPGFQSIFRVQPDEALRLDVFEPEDRMGLERAMRNARESGRVATTELRLSTTPPREVLTLLTPYGDETVRGGLILTTIDVTIQKRVEQLRTEFVANVSHELRTPLAAIRGYVETCLEPSPPGMEPPYGKFLPIIHQHAMRLNALIEDLLILSRIESRAMQFAITPLQPYPAVENVLATLNAMAATKGVTLVNAMPPLLPDIKADFSALERILINLVENAIKYSDEGGRVFVTARTQGDDVCMMVQDEGIGISKEHQNRIFERFYRVDKGRSRKAGGTGLGLSIVKHLVQSLGGEVWVDSEQGRGSTFFFTMPMAHSSEDMIARPPGMRSGAGEGQSRVAPGATGH